MTNYQNLEQTWDAMFQQVIQPSCNFSPETLHILKKTFFTGAAGALQIMMNASVESSNIDTAVAQTAAKVNALHAEIAKCIATPFPAAPGVTIQ